MLECNSVAMAAAGATARGDKISRHSANMFASILWQPGPEWGSLPDGDSRISVPIVSASRALHRPCQATGLSSACATPAGIDLPAREMAVWTKLQTDQPLTKHCAGETHYRGQTGLHRSRTPEPCHAPRLRWSACWTVDADAAARGWTVDAPPRGVPKTHVPASSAAARCVSTRARAACARTGSDRCACRPCACPDKVAEAEAPGTGRGFRCCWRDEHLIAIDKPAGTAVHGGSSVSFGVIDSCARRGPGEVSGTGARLDRETSGALLVAKKRSALIVNPVQALRDGQNLLALVIGAWPANKKVIDAAAQVPAAGW